MISAARPSSNRHSNLSLCTTETAIKVQKMLHMQVTSHVLELKDGMYRVRHTEPAAGFQDYASLGRRNNVIRSHVVLLLALLSLVAWIGDNILFSCILLGRLLRACLLLRSCNSRICGSSRRGSRNCAIRLRLCRLRSSIVDAFLFVNLELAFP